VHPEAVDLAAGESAWLPPQDVLTVTADLSLLLHGRDLFRKGFGPSTFIALPERGLKIRGITKSPAGLHFLGHVVRKRLLAGLRRCPPCKSTLQGVVDGELVSSFRGACADVTVSTDLTRATDLLPHDLVSAVIDGLEASGKLSSAEVEILRLLCGSQEIVYPTLGGKTVKSTRGILMGLPTSWAMLSIIHLFWWEDSIAAVAGLQRASKKEAFRLNRYAICGDDALFAGRLEVARQYSRLIESCGGVPSPGKHFECTGAVKRGVFIERLFEFQVEQGLIAGGTRNGAIPLRGLVRPDNPDIFREDGSRLAVAPFLKMLYAVDALWRTHPGGVKRLLSFLSGRLGRSLRSTASWLGLHDGLPIAQGGSGLPLHTRPSSEAERLRYRAALGLAAGTRLSSFVRGSFDSLWKMADDCVKWDLESFYAGPTFVKVREPEDVDAFSSEKSWPPPDASLKPPDLEAVEFVFCGTPSALQSAACASMYADLVLQMGVPPKTPHLTVRSFKRARARWLASLPACPEGADLSCTQVPRESVYVQRTRGPSGTVLYPRWVGETSSSEAKVRARLFAEAWAAPGARDFTPGH
jgi:hypothetical protein